MAEIQKVTLFITGTPKPQGSKSAFRRGNKIVMVEASKGLPEWRTAVIDAVKQNIHERMSLDKFSEPVKVSCVFVLPKPQKPKFAVPGVKPDLDKLVRGLLDPLVIGGLLQDDSLVVELSASKVYVGDTMPVPGCRVIVEKITNS